MQNTSTFIDQLIEEKGYSHKDPEIAAQMKADLESRLEDRINAMILVNMPEAGLAEFEKAIDSDDEDAINACVMKYIPDIDEKVASELLAFRSLYLA